MENAVPSVRDRNLMAALLDWRRNAAAKFRVPVFYILQEKTLRLVVDRKPLTLEGLLHIDGIAEVKLSYFGSELLEVVEAFLSPGERALKDYASSVAVKSCCHLCDACDSIMCPGCGVVHRNPVSDWSTTNALLRKMKLGQRDEVGEELKRGKTNLAKEFVMPGMEELHCPLNAAKRSKATVRKEAPEKVDAKSVKIQKAFLKQLAADHVNRLEEERPEPTEGKRPKRALAAKRPTPQKKSRVKKPPKRSSRRAAVAGGVKKAESRKTPQKTESPGARDSEKTVHLDKSFWDMASKVKKRAREALKRQELRSKKCRAETSVPSWIGQGSSSRSSTSELRCGSVPLFEEPPDLDRCSVPSLKRFLQQNGFTCPSDVVDAGELRSLAKNSLPGWEVQRVLQCEQLPPGQRHRAILRLGHGDGSEKMRSTFRKLSLMIHPDKNCIPEAGHAFYLLQAAVQYMSTEFRSC